MTDSFSASIEGYRDWLPYSGKRKGASTIRQYTRSAEQLAGWARDAHVDLTGLEVGSPSLEDAYLALTSEGALNHG